MISEAPTRPKIKPFVPKKIETSHLMMAALGLFALSSYCIFHAMLIAEHNHEGILLTDPFHHMFPPPADWSTWIFTATYSAAFLTFIACLIGGPIRLAFALIGYSSIVLLRSASMLLFPLFPPVDMILLIDPIVSYFNPGHYVATRDLFFSGHVASLTFFFLIAENKWLKGLLFFLVGLVAVAILWQRVHYSVDILGGLLIAWGVYRILRAVFARMNVSFHGQST